MKRPCVKDGQIPKVSVAIRGPGDRASKFVVNFFVRLRSRSTYKKVDRCRIAESIENFQCRIDRSFNRFRPLLGYMIDYNR